MAHRRPARPTDHRIRIRRIGAAGLLVVLCGIAAARGYHLPGSLSSTASASSSSSSTATTAPPIHVPRWQHRDAPGAPDSAVSDRTTIFDDEVPGVANLDPDLLDALRRAATDAAHDGVEFSVVSGWRSAEYQEQLFRQAVSKYGSEREAARWVATPNTSAHVSGNAVDIGPSEAAAWLSRRGAAYGLCQIYRNEPWHYELRPDAVGRECPSLYADPTRDPRMQQ